MPGLHYAPTKWAELTTLVENLPMKPAHLKPIASAVIISSDLGARTQARRVLEELDLQVLEARDGVGGLAAIAASGAEVVLIDAAAPGLDGYALCRKVYANRESAPGAVLMLIRLGDEAVSLAYAAGASDFICKPLNSQVLTQRVRNMLKMSNLLRDAANSDLQFAKAQLLTSVGSWEWYVGPDITYWSKEMYRICGVSADRFDQRCRGYMLMVHPEDSAQVENAMREALDGERVYDVEHRLLRHDGSVCIVQAKADVTCDAQGRPVSLCGTLQDITQRKQSEARIMHLANYDALTGLPNRNLLIDRVTQSISQARRTGQTLTMLCLDLDGFKFVNDSYGHTVGDTLLTMVAARLKGAIHEGDTVARLGGDEFVFILLGMQSSDDMAEAAQKILDVFAHPFAADLHELHVTASIGVSIFPGDGDSIDALLKNADVAMYSAKERGRNCFQFYTREMSERTEQRVIMENALRNALERQEFEVYYQPKVDMASGRISGVEALLRWHRPEHGVVPPASFIGLAEETRLIIPLGEWVLRTACAQARKWHDMAFHDLSVAVNLSACQFGKQNIAQLVRQVLVETALPPCKLELELTESVLMSDTDLMLMTLREIKEIGVVLALDDFGTGYSSLSYLRRFPIDVLKIDRSFILNITSDLEDAVLTKSIILLAQSLKMKTVAEGVETLGQLGFLNVNKCDMVQGFYFSRPITVDAMTAMLRAQRDQPLIGDAALREEEACSEETADTP